MGVTDRCDYRAKVADGENDLYRDANEQHMGPFIDPSFAYGFESGCGDVPLKQSFQEPDNAMCWEILNFGVPDQGDNDGTIYPSSTGPASGPGSATGGSSDGTGNFSGPNAGKYTGPGTGLGGLAPPGENIAGIPNGSAVPGKPVYPELDSTPIPEDDFEDGTSSTTDAVLEDGDDESFASQICVSALLFLVLLL